MSDSPPSKFQPLSRRSWIDLGPRLASAAVLIAVTLISLYFGGYVFAAVVGAVFAGCYREWDLIVTLKPLTPVGIVLIGLLVVGALLYPAFGVLAMIAALVLAWVIALIAGGSGAMWRVAGLAFFGLVIIAVLAMRGTEPEGMIAGIFLGSVIWLTDTGAYFTGRQVGGEKLAPDISPSKTWSGALGGFALGTLAGLVLWLALVPQSPWWIGLVLAGGLSIVGQVGDLAESAVKRHFRVKDSGDIIPGHGGLMDRLDSLTFGVLLLVIVGATHQGFGNVAAGFLNW